MSAPRQPNILLIGLRASGKSTVGRLLASRLGRAFIDLDDLTASELGAVGAGQALAAAGEKRFRQAEAVALSRVLSASGQVIALGGGTPMFEPARGLIAAACREDRAVSIYLRAPAATLRARLASDSTLRPALLGTSAIDEVDALFAQRDPVYRDLAHHVVGVEGLDPASIAERLEALLE